MSKEKFIVGDIVDHCGLEGKVTEAFTNEDRVDCITVEYTNGEEDTFLADGRIDTAFKKSALTLVKRAVVTKTMFVNIYRKASGELAPGLKLFDTEVLAKAKAKSTGDSILVGTFAVNVTA